MKNIKIKFEQVMAMTLLLAVMTIFFAVGEGDLQTQIAMGVLAGFSTAIGFIFGKMMPDKD